MSSLIDQPTMNIDDVMAVARRAAGNETYTISQWDVIRSFFLHAVCGMRSFNATGTCDILPLVVATVLVEFQCTITFIAKDRRIAAKMIDCVAQYVARIDTEPLIRRNIEMLATARWKFVTLPSHTLRGVDCDLIITDDDAFHAPYPLWVVVAN